LLIFLELKNIDAIVKLKREMIRRVEMCLKIRAGTSLINNLFTISVNYKNHKIWIFRIGYESNDMFLNGTSKPNINQR